MEVNLRSNRGQVCVVDETNFFFEIGFFEALENIFERSFFVTFENQNPISHLFRQGFKIFDSKINQDLSPQG